MEDHALSKTHAFLCFRIIHGMSKATEASPLRSGFGVLCLAATHLSCSKASVDGGLHARIGPRAKFVERMGIQ
jgi:hypothetical protein